VTPEEVPQELAQTAAALLKENGLWGAWEPEQTDEEVRRILAAVLPLWDRRPRAHETSSSPRTTVVVAEYHQHINYWCHQNRRSRYDRTIIRIVNGLHDSHKLYGLTDFELVILGPCRDYDEVMALIRQRQFIGQKMLSRPGEALATQRAISPVGPRHSSYGSSDPGRPSSPSAPPQDTPATAEPPESEPA
jgi:hypothetical protein